MDTSVSHVAIDDPNPSLLPPRGVSGHYQYVGLLGRGGMAEVHEVQDLRTGRQIAMKRLFPLDDAEKRAKARRLFELEFQTLSQLSHPRIVEVYDYAVDDVGPYYTMELLSGGDLSQLVPMDYRRACRLAKDVCSALSLLHSRSMVHRDLSPRNVRCTADGLAKLIDFGAMAPIGRSRVGIVGTPAYCAPEAVNGAVLDARTDLYALGATLYYALTGRHAYPAKDFASLPERWQYACPNPSEYARDVPPALDALVMELLRLDPLARPSSAFEVIARLCAIDGTPFDEQLVVAKAYLSTPTLVGRGNALSAVQRKIHRAEKGRGRAVLVAGPAGVGRSRFLDSATLEVKLRGTLVASADAEDGREGDWGVVSALAKRLVSEARDRALAAAAGDAGILGRFIPELGAARGGGEPPERAAVQQALRDWFGRMAQVGPLALVVDDFHAIDEPSAAALALLAHDSRDHRLLIIVSMDESAEPSAPGATNLFSDNADTLKLSPLTSDETDELLRSIFGAGPGVGLLAHRVHGVAAGNPRDTMELAQHLIDQGVIRYERGAWSVPGDFDASYLPDTMAQALEVRIERLSDDAREVARALSFAGGQTVDLAEVELLRPRSAATKPAAIVDELLCAHVLRAFGNGYGLSQEGWVRALQKGLSEQSARGLELRLAELFEKRQNDEFRHGRHLVRGGEVERGLDVLVAHASASQEQTNNDPDTFWKYLRMLPADWLSCYDTAIRLCEETGRPRRDAYALRTRLLGILGTKGLPDVTHAPALIRELSEYTGLTDFHAADPAMEPRERLRAAMQRAAERFAASPERDRVIDPMSALRHLGRAIVEAAGIITTALDSRQLKSMPSLLPFAALSPAFGVLQVLLDGMGNRYAARLEETRSIYYRLLERLEAPDRGGLEASHHQYTRLGVINGLAMVEAGMGLDSALDWAQKLELVPKSRVGGVRVRMLYQLWQGNATEANRLRQQVEVLQIQDSPRPLFEGTHLMWQVLAHGLSEDLTHLKRTLDEIAPLAVVHAGWRPVQHYGRGEYHRAGGAHEAALSEFQSALALVGAGEHQIWPYLAGAHLRVLDEMGRSAEVVELAEGYLRAAERERLGYVVSYVLMPLAVAHAKLGRKEEAAGAAERACAAFRAIGATGLNLGVAYEARARVALIGGEKQQYLHYLGLCRDVYTTHGNAALVTKFEKLRRSAPAKRVAAHAPLGNGFFTSSSAMGTSRLDLCAGPESRFSCALTMVMDQCGASAGVLYLVGAHGPFAAAASGNADETLRSRALEYLANEVADVETTGEGSSLTTGDSQAEWMGDEGERYRPVLLTHESAEGFLVTGVALVSLPPETPFSYPSRVANEVSKHLRRMGDVTGIVVAG